MGEKSHRLTPIQTLRGMHTYTLTKRRMNTHTNTHTYSLALAHIAIQTLALGQSATMVLAASEGQAARFALTKEMHP